MRIAIIGRNEILYNLIKLLIKNGHNITCVISSKHAPEYLKTLDDFRDIANSLNIPFASGSKIQEFREILINSKSDIALSMNYTGIIPEEIISIFKLGILNIHPGDLPRYRGNACLAWAILNNEKKVALCVHKMIGNELDSGDIITRSYMDLTPKTKIIDTWNWVSNESNVLVKEALQKLEEDPSYFLEKQSKNKSEILRCYPRIPEDGKIIWDKKADYILRLINASSKPYGGAFCFLNDTKITIWDADICEENYNFCAVPGQVTLIDNEKMTVACGEGKLIIREVDVNGLIKKPNDLIKSIRTRLN